MSTYDTFEHMHKFESVINDFDSVRILLYLDKYNPKIELIQLEKDLRIEKIQLAQLVDVMIQNHMIINEKGKLRLSNFGKMTAKNLKTLA